MWVRAFPPRQLLSTNVNFESRYLFRTIIHGKMVSLVSNAEGESLWQINPATKIAVQTTKQLVSSYTHGICRRRRRPPDGEGEAEDGLAQKRADPRW